MRAKLRFKQHVFLELILFFDLNFILILLFDLILSHKPIQTKTIPFPKSTFKTKVVWGRTLLLVLLTLVVNI